MKLKLLSQNLHCLVEEDIETKQKTIADEIAKRDIDIIFMQEVAQTHSDNLTDVKSDNYGLKLLELLREKGLHYFLYYEPIKKSFGVYDEGLAILSKYPLAKAFSRLISKVDDYENWKRRKVLGYNLSLKGKLITLATTHFGWTDEVEVFEDQFDLATKSKMVENLFILAGDYNVVPSSKEYKHIMSKNWINLSIPTKDNVYLSTFRGDDTEHKEVRRLDYIMTNKHVEVLKEEILFIDERVSDHYGLYIEIEL
ncbi:MAG: endonuclease/exonuclease/phosphatase family protein [Tenericutes bacterium]|nr:endonuclease/exonuclease/phosphatase family protein [Mycoplasmatota bacterium]